MIPLTSMKINEFLKKLDFSLEKKELEVIKKEAKNFEKFLKRCIKKTKTRADVFLGGSFAKGTLLKGEFYDIDFFVRFDKRYDNLSEELKKIMVCLSKEIKLPLEEVHGSRNYFRVKLKENLIFEVVPVLKIKKIEEAKNVTDLSYFHVKYVRKKITEKIKKEILIAKKFCKANGVYGAESYIRGFSGYGIECLLIYYKSFERMIRELTKSKEKIIIDPEKYYKKNNEIMFELNESKIKSPIILIDPTWKERNVLAGLSEESFEKFKKVAKDFLKTPKKDFFEEKKNYYEEIKKKSEDKGYDFLHVEIFTEKQEGDIAGAKLKKFSNFLKKQISKYFEVKEIIFEYDKKKSAELYISLEPKKSLEIRGPPIENKENAEKFIKKHSNFFERDGRLFSIQEVNLTAKDFLEDFKIKYREIIKSMDISEIKIHND